MPTSRSTKVRLMVISFVLAATLLLGYVAYWWIAAERLQSAVLGWVEARRAEGYTVAYGSMEREGFPIRLRLALNDPALASAAVAAPWSWSGSRLVVEIAPWAPLNITLRTNGPQTVKTAGPEGPLVYSGTAAMVSASITSDRSLPVRAIAIRDLIMTDLESNDVVAASQIDIALSPVVNGPGVDHGYDLAVQASDLRLPARLRLPLGEHVSRLLLDADVVGTVPSRPWPGGLFDWRDAGGIVEILELDVRYGPLRLTGAGTMALDGDGQPMGAFTARAEGVPETLDALNQRGLLPGFGAASAKLALKILLRPSETGAPGLNFPLTLQDRTLSAASLPLLKVPAIDWRRVR